MSIGKFAQAAVRPVVVAFLATAWGGWLAAPVTAGEVDDWVKEADQTLRGAERLMFSGKYTETAEQLSAADALLKEIEAADVGNAKLKTLRGKYEKLQKDLERRMSKDEPKSGSTPATADKPKGEKPAALPRSAREAMRDFQKIQRSIDHAYRQIENSKTTELSKPVGDYYVDIEKQIPALEAALKKAREVAVEEGVDSHPDLDEAQAYLDAQPERLSKVKAEMAAFEKDQAAQEAEEKAQKQAGGKIDVAQAQEDWKALAALCQEYQSNFLSESEVKKRGAVIRKTWDDWKKRFEPGRNRFRERYGDTNIDVYDAFEKVPKPEGVEMAAALAANLAYDIDCAQHEKQIADWAANWGKEALRVSNSILPDNKEKLERKYLRAEDAVNYYKLAKLWNPDGQYDEAIQKAGAAAAEALPLWKDMLKELTWPGHNKDYAGPGTPDEVAAAALAFLKEHPDWTAPEYDDEHVPHAACVEGKDWEIWKRAPLTQEPTQYSVAVLVAFTGKADPDLVYVYHMVFYTAEAAGVKPGLPIKYGSSKQYACYRMLKDNVPKPN